MRFIIGGMICLACMINYFVRGNMSIIILAMTKPINNITEAIPDYGPRYEWTAYEQSLVIGSYFWGMVITTFAAGIFAERYGPRKVAGLGIIFGAIFSAVSPIAANYLWLSIFVRFFTGVSMATISPSVQALIANWAPPEEKGKFLSAYLANGIGTVIDWSLSGLIIDSLGWPYAFYLVVLILGIFAIVWFTIIYDSPKNHPWISAQEKEFILSKLILTEVKTEKPWPPFKAMFSSIPFWALAIFHVGGLFSQYIFLTAMPKYLSEVHHFKMVSTGMLSSVPYFVRFIFAVGFGFIGDFIYKRKLLSNNATRKWFSICSHFVPAMFLIGISFVGNRPYLCVAAISLAIGFFGAISITTLRNPCDLSPNFSTTIFAFMHTIGSTPGFVAPLVVAHLTRKAQILTKYFLGTLQLSLLLLSSEDEWQHIFYIGAVILIVSAIIFILFGSGTVQQWNKIENTEDDKTEMKVFIERPIIEITKFK